MMVKHHARGLYFSPTSTQTRTYSSEKIKPIHQSKLIREYYIDSNCSTQVFEKSFKNGSMMFFRYVFLNADRCRGIPADEVYGDEIQDIIPKNLAIIEQTASHREEKWIVYAATPKTVDNTAEIQWKLSTQNEWMVPCERHTIDTGHKTTRQYWNILDRENIGKTGLICSKCGEFINPIHGRWVRTRKDGIFEGFRISQLMVPWKQRPHIWKEDITDLMEDYDDTQFDNEVLGVARDSGHKPITRGLVQANCFPNTSIKGINSEKFHEYPDRIIKHNPMFAGIDWGEGRENVINKKNSALSFTVLTIGTVIENMYVWPVFMKRYRGKEADPEFVKHDSIKWLTRFNVKMIGGDWGHGFGMNSHIKEHYKLGQLFEFYYSWNQKKFMTDDGEKFIVNRNMAIEKFISLMKKQRLLYPSWGIFEEFGKDLLRIFIDYTSKQRIMIYNHNPMEPDDSLHSLIYMYLVALIYRAMKTGSMAEFSK